MDLPQTCGEEYSQPSRNAVSAIDVENLAIRHSDENLDVCGNILQEAISGILSSDGPKTYDIGGSSTTSEVGDAVAARVQKLLKLKFG